MVFFEGNYPFYGVFCRCSLHYEKFQDGTVKCIEEEVPFDIPDSWVWVRLGALAQYKKGPFGSSMTKSMFVPDSPSAIKVYEQKNAINKDVSLGSYFVSEEKYETLKGFEIFPNDIIVSCAGTIGETYVMPETMRKGIINQALMKISLYDLRIIDFYLIYFDCQLKNAAREQGHGVALKNIPPFDVLKKYLVPIPPIQEQARIVDSVNDLLGIINSIDTYKDELHASVTSIKSKILDLAIRGKLVPQNPNDEPASVLLERIHAEKEELIKQGKIKRDKKESIIFKGDDNSYYETISENTICIDDTIPYDLPVGWSWCKLKSLSAPCDNSFVDGPFGSNLKTEHYTEKREVRIIQLNNIGEFVWRNNGIKYTTFKRAETLKRCISYPEDIVIAKMMPAGRTIIIPHIENIYVISSDCVRLQLSEQINNKYLMYMLNSPTINRNVSGDVHGIGRSRTSLSKLKELTIPLPPYAEQMRIVKSIETAFAYLDKISNAMS